jgi:hypothetical protein
MNVFLTSYRLGILFVTATDSFLFETADSGNKVKLSATPPAGSYLVDITTNQDNEPTLILIPFHLRGWKCCGSQVFREAGDKTTNYRLVNGRWVSHKVVSILPRLRDVGYIWYGLLFQDQLIHLIGMDGVH